MRLRLTVHPEMLSRVSVCHRHQWPSFLVGRIFCGVSNRTLGSSFAKESYTFNYWLKRCSSTSGTTDARSLTKKKSPKQTQPSKSQKEADLVLGYDRSGLISTLPTIEFDKLSSIWANVCHLEDVLPALKKLPTSGTWCSRNTYWYAYSLQPENPGISPLVEL